MSLSLSGARSPAPHLASLVASWRWTARRDSSHASRTPQLRVARAARRRTCRRMGVPPDDHLWRRSAQFIHGRLAWSAARMALAGGLAPWPARIHGNHSTGAACGLYHRHVRAAQARGAELRLSNVTGLLCRGGDVVEVDLDGETLTGDAVVIAMGPWSVLAAQLLAGRHLERVRRDRSWAGDASRHTRAPVGRGPACPGLAIVGGEAAGDHCRQ